MCFKCGKKFGPAHVCKSKGIHMLLVDDEDQSQIEEVEGKIIEYS